MNIRTAIGTSALALVFAAGSTIAFAEKSVELSINTAPPAPVVVETPPPRVGYIYEPGHYVVREDRYVWSDPRWIKEREGHHWTQYSLERRGDKWHYRAGHWDDD
jgi:hypothetical protein